MLYANYISIKLGGGNLLQSYSYQDSAVCKSMGQNSGSRNKPLILGDLVFNKSAKKIQEGKHNLFNKWYWDNWTSTCERLKLDSFFASHTKINSKWIIHLNVQCTPICSTPIKLLEEKIAVNLCKLALGKILLYVPSKAQVTKEKCINQTVSKLKAFVLQMIPSRKWKHNP